MISSASISATSAKLLPIHQCMENFNLSLAMRKRIQYQSTEILFLRSQLKQLEEERSLLLNQLQESAESREEEPAAGVTPAGPEERPIPKEQQRIASLQIQIKKLEQQLELQTKTLEQQESLLETYRKQEPPSRTIQAMQAQVRQTMAAIGSAELTSERQRTLLQNTFDSLLQQYRLVSQEHEALKQDVSHLDEGFFDELEDLKYRHQLALELIAEYEKVLRRGRVD